MSNVLAQTESLAFGKTLAQVEAEGTPAALVSRAEIITRNQVYLISQ